jgi:Double zinc ribbon/Phospholipase_D-nuclease N-terminal
MQVTTEKRTRFTDELRIIPGWARVLAVIVFVAVQTAMLVVQAHDAHPLPLWGRILGGFFAGVVLSCYVLLIGYINRDAGRRGMNRLVWTLLAIFIPNALGIILYFLLRSPLSMLCARCACSVQAGYSYCPRCGESLSSHCPRCQHAIHAGDIFCPYCGNSLTSPEPEVPQG